MVALLQNSRRATTKRRKLNAIADGLADLTRKGRAGRRGLPSGDRMS